MPLHAARVGAESFELARKSLRWPRRAVLVTIVVCVAADVMLAVLALRGTRGSPAWPSSASVIVIAVVPFVSLALLWASLATLRSALGETAASRAMTGRLAARRARLIRGVSKDLRGPLDVALGHTELLYHGARGELSPRQRQSVEQIRGAMRIALLLVHDLEALWRAESGTLAVRNEKFDVTELIGSVADTFAPTAARGGHAIVLDLDASAPPVTSDPWRVREILGNLLHNAIAQMPVGGRITVRTRLSQARADRAASGHVAVEVEDSGPGIDPMLRDLVFEEFAHASEQAVSAHGHESVGPARGLGWPNSGTGVGLAISRQVARLIGGDLTVTDASGSGCAFTLWLPLAGTSPLNRGVRDLATGLAALSYR